MPIKWDYTNVAKFYSKRPGYAHDAINWMKNNAQINGKSFICDIGAGTGNLTSILANYECHISAVEPNNEMRKIGEEYTSSYQNIEWIIGTGEKTNLPSNKYDLVTYASSFNVTNRVESLVEANRILKNKCWIACMWNHRDTENAFQKTIDRIIKSYIPNYDDDGYGKRHEDQEEIIISSGLFNTVKKSSFKFEHEFSRKDYVDSWKSHGTMHPDGQVYFKHIINDINELLLRNNYQKIIVPYITKIWMAQLKQ